MNNPIRRYVAAFACLFFFVILVLAEGHSPFCSIIDSGGGWYKTNEVYAFGRRTKFIADMQRLPKTGKPISVQVQLINKLETSSDPLNTYLSRLNDVRAYAPNRSILTLDGGGRDAPVELTLKKLDVVPNRIKVYHDIPSDLAKARIIHGDAANNTTPRYFQNLRTLKTQLAQLQTRNAGRIQVIDLNEVTLQANTDLRTYVRKEIEAGTEDELIIVIGHNEIDNFILDTGTPSYQSIVFHDNSTLPLDRQRTMSNLWYVTCDLYESGQYFQRQPFLSSLDKFGYGTAVEFTKTVLTTRGSIRDMIINVQKQKVTVPGGLPRRSSNLDVFQFVTRYSNSVVSENVFQHTP